MCARDFLLYFIIVCWPGWCVFLKLHYNLPFLGLPSSTTKDTALEVFINMNTNSKPLSQYDIIVAEI